MALPPDEEAIEVIELAEEEEGGVERCRRAADSPFMPAIPFIVGEGD